MGEARPTTPEAVAAERAPADGSSVPRHDRPYLSQTAPAASLTRDTLRRVRRNPGAVAGAIVLASMILLAIFAPLVAPYCAIDVDNQAIRARPCRDHLFGADSIGRDVFSRVIFGGRQSLPIGLVAVGIAAVVGVTSGLIAGYYGRCVDSLVMRGVDLMLAFPGLLLAMALVAILGSSLFNLMLAVGIASIPEYTRVVRGSVLSAREMEYVTAARVSGASDRAITFRHIFPNVRPPVIVLATLGIAGAIILGSTLSFLGLGIEPPTPEWGNMLQDGRSMIRHSWWVSFYPGLAIMLAVLAINLLADGLRDALDPRLRGR